MKRFFCSAAAALVWIVAVPPAARADDTLKQVQQSLRDQGFYYGSIDGAPGDETTQALRRYQIRNGLPVSGQLNDETKQALLRGSGGSGGSTANGAAATPPAGTGRPHSTPSVSSQPTPRPSIPPVSRVAPTPADEATDSGGFHRGEAGPANPPVARIPARAVPDADEASAGAMPPVTRPGGNGEVPDLRVVPPEGVVPSARLTAVFAGTPYEFAPPPVQSNVIRRAQNKLLRQGFYDRDPDGRPNALLVEALTNFQGFNRLRRTGRLDTATLAALRLLPGTSRGGLPNGDYDENGPRRGPGPNRAYEGRIVQ